MRIPQVFLPKKDLDYEVEKLLKDEKPSVQPVYSKLEVIFANTYAEGVAKLKEKGQKPFAFSDNIEARIADYKSSDKDAKLFDTWLDSVTGIAYKAKSTKFKIILRSDKLENIAKGFNRSFIPIDYGAEKGIGFDSMKGKYNQSLTREEVINHEFWIAVMNGDKKKLAKYVDIWFDKTGKDKGMGVFLKDNTSQDELRKLTLFVNYSGAYGDYGLYGNASFVSDTK